MIEQPAKPLVEPDDPCRHRSDTVAPRLVLDAEPAANSGREFRGQEQLEFARSPPGRCRLGRASRPRPPRSPPAPACGRESRVARPPQPQGPPRPRRRATRRSVHAAARTRATRRAGCRRSRPRLHASDPTRHRAQLSARGASPPGTPHRRYGQCHRSPARPAPTSARRSPGRGWRRAHANAGAGRRPARSDAGRRRRRTRAPPSDVYPTPHPTSRRFSALFVPRRTKHASRSNQPNVSASAASHAVTIRCCTRRSASA